MFEASVGDQRLKVDPRHRHSRKRNSLDAERHSS
jgi:hypothetical protein